MKRYNLHGFTLVELLLSIALGLVVISGVLYVYIAVVVSSSSVLKSSKLNTQMMTIMSVMVNDIRRAGYWRNPTYLNPSDNPFNVEDDSLLVVIASKVDNTVIKRVVPVPDPEPELVPGSCILFSYDSNNNGLLDNSSANNNEYFGYRWDGTDKIQMRTLGVASITAGCNDGSGNVWVDLTDNDIYQIDSLTFNPQGSTCVNSSEPDGENSDGEGINDDDIEYNCNFVVPVSGSGHITVDTREILIEMSGSLKNDPSVTSSIFQTIRVRNDLVRVR